jgi:hypothetical protein
MTKKALLFGMFMLGGMMIAQPKIEFKAIDNTIDYGTVTKDADSGIRVFEFTNTGTEPLLITNAQSTCGCTVPSFSKEPIAPGANGKIEVKYNMNPGPIRKTITIESNASNVDNGRVALKIKGEVIVKPAVNVLEPKKNLLMTK